jgi:hypothetical protein
MAHSPPLSPAWNAKPLAKTTPGYLCGGECAYSSGPPNSCLIEPLSVGNAVSWTLFAATGAASHSSSCGEHEI